MPEHDSAMTDIILKSKTLLSKMGMIEMEEKKRIKFQEEQLDYLQTDFDSSTLNEKGLRVLNLLSKCITTNNCKLFTGHFR